MNNINNPCFSWKKTPWKKAWFSNNNNNNNNKKPA